MKRFLRSDRLPRIWQARLAIRGRRGLPIVPHIEFYPAQSPGMVAIRPTYVSYASLDTATNAAAADGVAAETAHNAAEESFNARELGFNVELIEQTL